MNSFKSVQFGCKSLKKKVTLVSLQILVCFIHSVSFYWTILVEKLDQIWGGGSALAVNFLTIQTPLDLVTKNRNVVFLKNGTNLDSLFKVTGVLVLTQLTSLTVLLLDKYVVAFSIKKNAESLLNSYSGVFNAFKRSLLGAFAVFWYTLVLFLMLFFLV